MPGMPGMPGMTGPMGMPGMTGPMGMPGMTGPMGMPGMTGPMGMPGMRTPPPAPVKNDSPILILLDMNGTLLLRLKGKLAGSGASDFTHAGLHYYLRSGVTELVSMLIRHPRARVAFYTSMRESNAKPAVIKV